MSVTRLTLRQQIKAYEAQNEDWIDDDCYQFYDWFCASKSLERKSKSLMTKAIKVIKLLHIDVDKHYIWFKNNLTGGGVLYDDFRIADIETGDVIYNVSPSDGHTGMARIYYKGDGFETPKYEAESWRQLIHRLKWLDAVNNTINNNLYATYKSNTSTSC